MKGVKFKEANTILTAPKGTEGQVYDLPVWRGKYADGQTAVISLWRPSLREWLSFLIFRKVWFHCWGTTHPPILIGTKKPFGE